MWMDVSRDATSQGLVGAPLVDDKECCLKCWKLEHREAIHCLMPKEILEENFGERASRKNDNREQTSLFAITKRQLYCHQRPLCEFPDSVPTIHHEKKLSRRRARTFGVEVKMVGPAEEVLIGQKVLRARGGKHM